MATLLLPPFLDPETLPDDGHTLQRRTLAPQAPIVQHLGARFERAQLAAVEQHADLSDEVLAHIAAWPVTTLHGATLELVDLTEAAIGLQRLLRACVPEVAWEVPDDLAGPLGKYLVLHTSLAAPPNEAVPEAMALEVHATCVSVDGVRLETAEGQAWYREFLARDTRHGALHALGRLRFEVRAATWANVSYPGIGVPFYL